MLSAHIWRHFKHKRIFYGNLPSCASLHIFRTHGRVHCGFAARLEQTFWPLSTTTRTRASPSWQKVVEHFSLKHYYFPPIKTEYRAVHNQDYWTSGTQKDCPGKMSWCSLDRPVRSRNLSWSASSDGDCIAVKYGPNATSTFTKTACEKQLPFICEVKFILSATFTEKMYH
jgi:hypothetical protein